MKPKWEWREEPGTTTLGELLEIEKEGWEYLGPALVNCHIVAQFRRKVKEEG